MKPYEIHLSDIQRIFIGEVPPSFYIELVLRTIVIYIILMVSMRVMGKRMSAQLGRNELAALVSLAAAIGVPLQAPDRGLVPAIIIAFVIVFFQYFISKIARENEKFEHLTQDSFSVLVENSVMDLNSMKKTRISRERLFAQLRSQQITHLGMVKRVYLEANGSFTLIKYPERKSGLNILPQDDTEFITMKNKDTRQLACISCGNIVDGNGATQRCPNCGEHNWDQAKQ